MEKLSTTFKSMPGRLFSISPRTLGVVPGGERPGHPGGVPRGEEEAEKIGESREVGCLEVPQGGGHSQDDGMGPYSGGVFRRGIVEENRIL